MALFRAVTSRAAEMRHLSPAASLLARHLSEATNLRDVLTKKVPVEQEKVKAFRKQYGATKVGDVTVDMVKQILTFPSASANLFCDFCGFPCLLASVLSIGLPLKLLLYIICLWSLFFH